MVIGDFNGDGRPEIAGLVTLPSGGLQIVIYTVDPTTLAVSSAARLTLQKALAFEFGPYVSITAGRFTSLTHDQIVVADGGFLHDNPNGGDWLTKLELLIFPLRRSCHRKQQPPNSFHSLIQVSKSGLEDSDFRRIITNK